MQQRRFVAMVVVAIASAALASPASAGEPGPGDRDKAAAASGRSPAELDGLLAEDETARVGAGGRLQYVEPASSAAAPLTPQAAPFPYAQSFQLHSRPGAQRVIYLDFDGHQISGTGWNGSFGAPSGSFFAEPFSLDANATFSDAELDVVQSVWQRVSEDYVIFDVDVTTQEPPAASITRSGSGDQVYGTRALITDMPEISGNCGCGGIAYVGVFDEPASHAFYQPALVFPENLGNGVKNIAEATSHEVGHNLGLDHDGTASLAYYGGHGAWAPIMGVGYDRPIVQWSRGEYSGANNAEADISVMNGYGAPLRTDDHGDTSAAATPLGSGPALNAVGVITTDADIDVFRVSAGVGSATFSVAPAPVSPDLDARLEVRNAAGTLLASADPASSFASSDLAGGLGASVTLNLPSTSDYFVSVTGVGAGSALSTGYSGYGSLGAYSLAGTVPGGGGGPPTLSINDVSMAEGNAGTTNASFTVSLSAPAVSAVSVGYATANGTAVAPVDFIAVSGQVTVAQGASSAQVLVPVRGDTTAEPNETFSVNLSGPSGATVADGQGTGTIVNDDGGGGGAPSLSIADASVSEGNNGTKVLTFTLTLSAPATKSVKVKAATANGTAIARSDYKALSGLVVSFPAGTTTRTVSVSIYGDITAEPNETFSVNLSGPSGATVADGQGTGTILNDD